MTSRPAPAQGPAQTHGVVTASTGQPLDHVMIELWAAGRRTANAETGAGGVFVVPTIAVLEAQTISLRRIGYRMITARLGHVDSLSFIMTALPVPLPTVEISVRPVRKPCPNTDDPVARALWQAASGRYSRTTLSRGFAAYVMTGERSVPPENVANASDQELSLATRRYAGATWPPSAGRYSEINHWVEEHGYALRLDHTPATITGNYLDWVYPELWSRHAAHFASATYGKRHTFSVFGTDADATMLAFCGIDRKAAYLEGILTIARDSTFLSATWGFYTRKPDEAAGGEVTFAPRATAAIDLPHLLAARGTFWRRLGGSRLFFQRTDVYLRWKVGSTSAIPDLPAY